MKLWETDPNKDIPLLSQHRFAGMTGATVDAEVAVYEAVYPVTVVAAKVTFDAAVTGAATNNFAATVNLYRAGSLVGAMASLTFVLNTNATKWVAVDLGAITTPVLQVGDVLTVALTHNGTGIQAPAGVVTLDFRVPTFVDAGH